MITTAERALLFFSLPSFIVPRDLVPAFLTASCSSTSQSPASLSMPSTSSTTSASSSSVPCPPNSFRFLSISWTIQIPVTEVGLVYAQVVNKAVRLHLVW
ncbi:hypothetical protein B0T14DRAFT_507952 [Immersiella caudata]|uniref:Uncharacterized protein n=1 Tax=Immersiella caudata TaxID=314043 RepID=A0AA39XH80_9PEZI|nr:hypothetical protein B0T14DRAFT_507952 [Immersiella caudata]